jgi:hypothetical protein
MRVPDIAAHGIAVPAVLVSFTILWMHEVAGATDELKCLCSAENEGCAGSCAYDCPNHKRQKIPPRSRFRDPDG